MNKDETDMTLIFNFELLKLHLNGEWIGADALQRAIERSEKFGQQSERMSQTARDARQAAEALEEAAGVIETTAQEALNTSSNAYNLARDAVDQQKNTSQEIGKLIFFFFF